MSAYKLIISISGAILLFFFSMCSYAGMESLRIEPKQHSTAGTNCLIASLVKHPYLALWSLCDLSPLRRDGPFV